MGSVCPGGARKRFGATCSGYSQDDEKRGMFCMKPTLATDVGDPMCFVHPDLQPNVVNAEGTTEKTFPRRSENAPPLVACHPTFSSRLPGNTQNNVYNRWWARRLATPGVPTCPRTQATSEAECKLGNGDTSGACLWKEGEDRKSVV